MAIRIVNEGGPSYTTKVYDAETGEDLTTRLNVSRIELTIDAKYNVPTAQLTVYTPKVEITLEEAQVKQVCPYCGHETDKTLRSAEDLKEPLPAEDKLASYQAYLRNLQIMERDPEYARKAGIDVAIRQYQEQNNTEQRKEE